jgi:hypothetical protein
MGDVWGVYGRVGRGREACVCAVSVVVAVADAAVSPAVAVPDGKHATSDERAASATGASGSDVPVHLQVQCRGVREAVCSVV